MDLRIEVKLDIGKALWGDDDGSIVGGKDCWCPTKYEFLPIFCYVCGLLGHY